MRPAGGRDRSGSEVVAGMGLVVIGMDVFIIQPGVVQAFVDMGSLTESEAGYVASAEMFGIAAATVLMVYVSRRLPLRVLACGALLINAAANLACLVDAGMPVLAALRSLVGLSSGALISAGYALVGRSLKPDRDFGLLIAVVLCYGAIGLLILPNALQRWSLHALYGALSVFAVLGLLSLSRLAVADAPLAADTGSFTFGGRAGAWLLVGIMAFFLGQGMVWPYLALIGTSSGTAASQVGVALMVSQFVGIGGAALVAACGAQHRHAALLSAGIVSSIGAMTAFFGHLTAVSFTVAVSVFNLAANFVTPLLMAIVATAHSPRLIMTGAAVQMLGLAIGPAVAASVIQPGEYTWAIGLGIDAFAVSLFAGLRGCRLLHQIQNQGERS